MFLNFIVLILRFRGLTSHQLKWIFEFFFLFFFFFLQDAPGNGKSEQKTEKG